MMPRVFTGFDQRESAGWHAFAQSVIEHSENPVEMIPLASGLQRDGSNTFTYARFAVPELCNYGGWALFVDGADMICMADIHELWDLRDSHYAVQVVKHQYKTKHPRKYLGTEMEADNADYPRKNWSSVILWNCGHIAHFYAREKLLSEGGAYLHRFGWLDDDLIGELPIEWNWLADEYGANTKAKLIHFTAGIPSIYAHRHAPHAAAWHLYSARSNEGPAERRIKEVASAR